MEDNKVKANGLNHAVGLAQSINILKSEKAQLELDIDMLMETKQWYETEPDETKREYYKTR